MCPQEAVVQRVTPHRIRAREQLAVHVMQRPRVLRLAANARVGVLHEIGGGHTHRTVHRRQHFDGLTSVVQRRN